jgi:hypothetical protein
MQLDDVPEWCLRGTGRGAVVVLAPHGGRRRSPRAVDDTTVKVNDVHTAELAAELAAAVDASYIINTQCDRNDLDLNRVSQIRARAPWFLALLEAMLDGLLRRHATVELLVVHGWNVTQPKCDIGIGRRLASLADADSHGDLTVSSDYVSGRLAALHAACLARGISSVFGERYPARHPNNLLQLFRHVPRPQPPSPRLAAWAAAGRIEAVQLELGVPLRWPGRLRGAFVDAVGDAFRDVRRPSASAHHPCRAGAAPSPQPASHDQVPRPPAIRSRSAGSLQCYDAGAGTGVIARTEAGADGAVAQRLLLFIEDGQVGLFTGEGPPDTACNSGGLHIVTDTDGLHVSFDGHVLLTDDGSLFVDLEDLFLSSRLCAVQVELRFRALHTAELGAVSGRVCLDGVERRIETIGFSRPVILQRTTTEWRSQLGLAAALAPELALQARLVVPGTGATMRESTPRGTSLRPLPSVAVQFSADGFTPTRFVLGETVAEPVTRVALLRPNGGQQRARVNFGIARVTHGAITGFGFYEYARVLLTG